MKTFVTGAALVCASVAVVLAQGAPAVQPAKPASPQPAAPATATPTPAA